MVRMNDDLSIFYLNRLVKLSIYIQNICCLIMFPRHRDSKLYKKSNILKIYILSTFFSTSNGSWLWQCGTVCYDA